MNIQDIVDMQELAYPSPANWTDGKKVDSLNREIKENFRDMQIRAAVSTQTVADTYIYAMPSGVSKEFIRWVGYTTDTTIDDDSTFRTHEYAKLGGQLSGRKWYDALDSYFGIYPIPDTTSENIVMIYDKVPAALSEDTTTAIPEIQEAWHRILVYALIIDIAGSGNKPNSKMVNMYARKYNDLKMQILMDKHSRGQSYPVTKDVMPRRRGSRLTRTQIVTMSDLIGSYGYSTVSEVIARNV